MESYLQALAENVERWGMWFIVFFLFIENIPLIGFIAPGLTILVLSGFSYSLLAAHPGQVFIVAYVTIVVADNCWYWCGRLGNSQAPWLQKIATKSPNIDTLLTKQPRWMLVFYQFLPYFRMFLPFALGLYQFSRTQWLIINAVGTFLYVAVFFGIGYVTKILFDSASSAENVTSMLNTILAISAVIYGLVLIKRYQQLKAGELKESEKQ